MAGVYQLKLVFETTNEWRREKSHILNIGHKSDLDSPQQAKGKENVALDKDVRLNLVRSEVERTFMAFLIRTFPIRTFLIRTFLVALNKSSIRINRFSKNLWNISGSSRHLFHLVEVAGVGQGRQDSVEFPQPLVDEDRPLRLRQRQQRRLVQDHRLHLVRSGKSLNHFGKHEGSLTTD